VLFTTECELPTVLTYLSQTNEMVNTKHSDLATKLYCVTCNFIKLYHYYFTVPDSRSGAAVGKPFTYLEAT